MTDRTPVSLSEAEIAAVRSWVIHEDDAVIAFNKPAGLSSQGGRIQAQLALGGLHFGDIDVEVADRIGLELLLGGLVAFDLRQPRYAVPGQAAMQ